MFLFYFIISVAKEIMFSVVLFFFYLSFSLFVCEQYYLKIYERLGMKFYGGVQGW